MSRSEVEIIRIDKTGIPVGVLVESQSVGEKRLGVYIRYIIPGSAADRDGRLGPGDQLLSVDGQSLLGIPTDKAFKLLDKLGNIVTFEVAKRGSINNGLTAPFRQLTPHRKSKRIPERRYLSCIDSETNIPPTHDPGYSRTSSNNNYVDVDVDVDVDATIDLRAIRKKTHKKTKSVGR